jgi:hypothetical protein
LRTWLGCLQRLEASTFSLAVRLLCQYAACEDGASALAATIAVVAPAMARDRSFMA